MKFISINITIFLLSFNFLFAQQHRSINGFGNNFDHPFWGASGVALKWETPAGYADGVSEPAGFDQPNPRYISNMVFEHGEDKLPDEQGRSPYVWLFGQFLEHEVSFVPEMRDEPMDITIPAGDRLFAPAAGQKATIPFFRSVYDARTGTDPKNPRTPVNAATSWIDGSAVYGSSQEHADWLRTFQGGKLKTSTGDFLPFNTLSGEFDDTLDFDAPPMLTDNPLTTRLFAAGSLCANEHVWLTALHTLFVREHNHFCDILATQHPSWNDEQTYQHARRYVGALIQQIAFYEWLPALGVQLPAYRGYKPDINPNVGNVFASAALAFQVSMTNGQFMRMDNYGNELPGGMLSFREAVYNPVYFLIKGDFSHLLKGMAAQTQEKFDTRIVDELRNLVYGDYQQYVYDAAAICIQKGRERGIPEFNTVRQSFGLPAINSFKELTDDPAVEKTLAGLYGGVDKLDAWVGMMAEKRTGDALFGATLTRILESQFLALRDGDRFYFENDPRFSAEEIVTIRNTRLSDLIKRNSDIVMLQKNVFFAVPHDQLGVVAAVKNHLDIAIFPNPVVQDFQLAIKSDEAGQANLILSDFTGKTIQKQQLILQEGLSFQTQSLPENLAPGLYFLTVLMDGRVNTVPLIHH